MCQSLPTSSQLKIVSDRALAQVWEEQGVSLPESERGAHVEAVADILQTNISNGRWQRVAGASEAIAMDEAPFRRYAAWVAKHYLALWDEDRTLVEISRLRLGLAVVVLSACQSGLGEINAGDEIVSLPYAFFAAGARAVVASQWHVDDASTPT